MSSAPAVSAQDVAAAIEQIAGQPEALAAAARDAAASLPADVFAQVQAAARDPEVARQARRLAAGPQGARLAASLLAEDGASAPPAPHGNHGNPPPLSAAQIKQLKKKMKPAAAPAARGLDKRAVHIKPSRAARDVGLDPDAPSASAAKVLRCDEAVEMACSRLSVGPFADWTFRIYVDPAAAGANRRLTRLVGFTVGGGAIVAAEDADFTEADLLKIEKLL